jgi:hypothetical protein
MKFAAFALVAFASTAAALPPTFVEQCCGDFVGPAYSWSWPVGDIPMEEWMLYTVNDVVGYSNPKCIGILDEDKCVTSEELCASWSYGSKDGSEVNGFVKPGSNNLLCCPLNDEFGGPYTNCGCDVGTTTCSEAEPLDNPWTCAVKIGWSAPFGMPAKAGPDATAIGGWCGQTDTCKDTGGCVGDPHFQTWSGEWFDFHGECDLKFMEVPQFAKGLGMEVQIRTKARYEYSFVEAAAIRIGDDVLEVSSYGEYMFNGVENADLKNAKFMGEYEIEHQIMDAQHHVFRVFTGVDLVGRSEAIQIKTFKDLVAVKMESAFSQTFATSTGMMGDFAQGRMFARDGKTLIEDPIEFGMEWQVKSDETSLFQTPSPVTGKCIMPSANASAERRRLGETVPLEAAVAACEAVNAVHHENCVYDVMATGDLEIAHAGVF